jgi:hypothetical protein
MPKPEQICSGFFDSIILPIDGKLYQSRFARSLFGLAAIA